MLAGRPSVGARPVEGEDDSAAVVLMDGGIARAVEGQRLVVVVRPAVASWPERGYAQRGVGSREVHVDQAGNVEDGEGVVELAGRVVDRPRGRAYRAWAQPLGFAAGELVHRDPLAQRVRSPPVGIAGHTRRATRPDGVCVIQIARRIAIR